MSKNNERGVLQTEVIANRRAGRNFEHSEVEVPQLVSNFENSPYRVTLASGKRFKDFKDRFPANDPKDRGSAHETINTIQGLVSYLLSVHLLGKYVSAETAIVAAGWAAVLLQTISPLVAPFLLGYSASRLLSSYNTNGIIGWAGSILLGIAAFVTVLSPIAILSFTLSGLAMGVMAPLGFVVGWVTRHTGK